MNAKTLVGEDTKAKTVPARDPANETGRLKQLGGSSSDNWNNVLANQALQTLWTKHSDEEALHRLLAAAALVGISPRDELEGMIAAQLLAAHNADGVLSTRHDPRAVVRGPTGEPQIKQTSCRGPMPRS